MPVEKATFDNDSMSVQTANWVDCPIVVDLRFLPLVACCLNGLHYSNLRCNLDSPEKIAHCFSYCCLFPAFVGCHTGYCMSYMCKKSVECAEY